MKFLIISFLFFIFIISIASAETLSISPTQIDFVGETNEVICNEITIKTSEKQNLIGEDRWAQKGETRKKFLLHNLSSNELNLKLEYNELLISSNNTNLKICLDGKNPGIYHGLLLYRIDNTPTGAGIWMNVSLKDENSFTKMTGNIITGAKQTSKLTLAIIPIIFLTIIFILLIFKLKIKLKNN